MKDIKKLIRDSKAAIQHIENGKSYPSKYVAERFIVAAEQNPKDILINTMRDVIVKRASKKDFMTQKEIGETYNKLYGFSSGGTRFKDVLGDLIYKNLNKLAKENKDVSGSRIDMSGQLDNIFSKNEEIGKASKEFENLFSLNKKASFSALGSKTSKSAEKYVYAELKSIGVLPKNVRAVHSNEHFILCSATFPTNSFRETRLNIPVRYAGVNVSFPDKFVNIEGNLEDLNKANLLTDLKSRQTYTEANNSSYYKQLRASDSLSVDKLIVPKSLEKYSHFEDFAANASSKFTKKQIEFAKNVVYGEISSSGIVNAQIKTFASDESGVIVKASIPTTEGRKEIEIPVEFYNSKPLMPSVFSFAGKEYDFSTNNLRKFANRQDKKSLFAKDYNSLKTASYHELSDIMINSIRDEDYRSAEDCLYTIQSRFDESLSKKAFDLFNSSMSSFNKVKSDTSLVKEAMKRGDLISIPTSLEPYSPKYGLPLSKLSFDEKGRLMIKGKREKIDNMKDSETIGISSYNIKFT